MARSRQVPTPECQQLSNTESNDVNVLQNKLLDKLDAIQGANRRTVSDDYCDREPMSDEERDAMRQSAQEVFDAIRELANTPDDGSRRRRGQ